MPGWRWWRGRAMQEHDMSWVRTEMTLAQPAPSSERGLTAW
ncbi:MAG: amino acid ABC transporter permease, partial [Mesorhizobium sp.]